MNQFLVILLVLVLAGCTAPKLENPGVTVQSVEKDIQDHLPIGSSKADVFAYLDQRKFPHSWLQKGGQISPDGQSVIFPNRHTEAALIRDVRMDGMVRTDIQIFFKFDDSDSKLINYSVREIYTGP